MRHLLLAFALVVGVFGTASSQAATSKQWTLLVYLNGNNSLDSYGSFNIKEMEKVGSTDKVDVVVQWASIQNGTTKRLHIQKSTDPNNVTSPVVQDLGVVDMGSVQTLNDFIKWGVANYPAAHYFIDVWDHGGGFHLEAQFKSAFNSLGLVSSGFGPQAGPDSGITPQDISWDDNSGHFISTKELGSAITQAAQVIGHPVDVYGSDACLMAMPEVASEMAGAVNVYVGSEETEPSAGWPYDTLLTQWNALSTPTAADVGRILTDAYVASYQNGSHGTSDVTFSAFDMSQLNVLDQAVTNLGTQLSSLSATAKTAALKAVNTTQTFEYHDFGDLVDFTNQLGVAGVGVRNDVLGAVRSAVESFVIDSKVTSRYSTSHGVSIWLPADADTLNSYWSMYSQFVFQQTTKWGTALKSVLGVP